MNRTIMIAAGITFLSGCDVSPMAKAKQDMVCNDKGGVYEYAVAGMLTFCRDGTMMEWHHVTLTPEFYPEKGEEK